MCSSCLTEEASDNINQLKLGDSLINRVSTTKFLGVWLDDQLNWKTHLNKLLSKLKCGLGMLQRSKELLSYKAKKLLAYLPGAQPSLLRIRGVGPNALFWSNNTIEYYPMQMCEDD